MPSGGCPCCPCPNSPCLRPDPPTCSKLRHYENDCGGDNFLLNALSTSSNSGEDDDDTSDREACWPTLAIHL